MRKDFGFRLWEELRIMDYEFKRRMAGFMKSISFVLVVLITGLSSFLLTSCNKKSLDGLIIFTQVKEKLKDSSSVKGNSRRYVLQSQIVELDPSKSNKSVKVLTGDYYSACSPEVSCDGKHLLFAGQLKQNEPWQIWEMDLTNLKARQVTFSKNNCIDPAYLPLGGFVFTGFLPDDSVKSGYSLFTGNLDGSDIKRITFNPHTYCTASVLQDGRILSNSRKVYPEQGNALLLVMRPDGTKSELFYNSPDSSNIESRGWETLNNDIVFIESHKGGNKKSDIISVNYNEPFHSRENLTSKIGGDFGYVYPEESGKFLVSYRKSGSEPYGLYEFDPNNRVLSQALYDKDFDVSEAVEVRVHKRARKLPSEVHMDIKTGLIVCQNVNLLDPKLSERSSLSARFSAIEIMGVDSSLGVIHPRKDGSFYLRVLADKPFQIRTVDKDGNVIQSCDWIWLRPNERRGCVGCHENHELAPENRIPMAVKKSPISVPVHVNKIEEKFIDTE